MVKRKRIVGICGSASENSSNLSILKSIEELEKSTIDFEILDSLAELPHFKTSLTTNNVPEKIIQLRTTIEQADGVIICTPEYIFSIPSGLKNLMEWYVSTSIFTKKPTELIVASADGVKVLEELELIMKTIQASITRETTLLIQGVKGKINPEGQLVDEKTEKKITTFNKAFINLLNTK